MGRKAARWARDNLAKLRDANPEIPNGLDDRAADAWEPLLAIAECAGEEWPKRARKASLALSGEHVKEDDEIGTLLLGDIQQIFAREGRQQIKSEELVAELVALEERPWPEFGRAHKPLTATQLARLLRGYKIKPSTIRTGPGDKDTAKGYKLAQFSGCISTLFACCHQRSRHTVTSE
jgi:hypothetical protein